MRLIDRHIAARFLWNFLVLFALLFVFAVSIDVILQLDRFLDAADSAVERGEFTSRGWALLTAIFNFHGPRVFQFYAYLLGLVSVAAMGFTLAQMHRHRELVALLSSGLSLPRIAVPIVVAALMLNVVQLFNSELVVPRLATLLAREHADILAPGVRSYPITLTPDGQGRLIAAESFDPLSRTMSGLLVLERDDRGTLQRRVVADRATWDPRSARWRLEGGRALTRMLDGAGPLPSELDAPGPPAPAPDATRSPMGSIAAEQIGQRSSVASVSIDAVEIGVDPEAIAVRRSAPYAQMLSLTQLRRIEESGGVDPGVLARARWGRFATVVANMLVLLLAMPSFLLREPANLLRQSVRCSAIAILAMLAVLVGLTLSLPGVPAGLTVFAPALVLAPLAVGRVLGVRT